MGYSSGRCRQAYHGRTFLYLSATEQRHFTANLHLVEQLVCSANVLGFLALSFPNRRTLQKISVHYSEVQLPEPATTTRRRSIPLSMSRKQEPKQTHPTHQGNLALGIHRRLFEALHVHFAVSWRLHFFRERVWTLRGRNFREVYRCMVMHTCTRTPTLVVMMWLCLCKLPISHHRSSAYSGFPVFCARAQQAAAKVSQVSAQRQFKSTGNRVFSTEHKTLSRHRT